ncbi:hypothetical protein [Stakelama tenebrarum]|uniref:Lipoprotein n=1 Tax=Stakelama tenebrarum TaxID=2711215 RepID=A0A6G6Y2S7_9SPHN|nr:hypothetical protein [Sphingosinithalassobacter tenebrarum]QIG79254.1 hypothetical protein G5C33_05230 [Sphingosinithalassobacter tenebrarum]
MISRAVLPALIALALAGCGGGSDGNAVDVSTLNEQQRAALERRAPDPEKVMAERWMSMFDSPDAVLSAAADMGYEPRPYAEGMESFSTGYSPEQTLPEGDSPVQVITAFRAVGVSAEHITDIAFTFTLKGDFDAPKAKEALAIPRRIIGGFLGRFEVGPGDEIATALRNLTSAETTQHGVVLNVDAVPGEDDTEKRLIVTISRATAPTD